MSEHQTHEVTVSNRTIVRLLLLGLATIFLLRFIHNVGHSLELIFIAFFF